MCEKGWAPLSLVEQHSEGGKPIRGCPSRLTASVVEDRVGRRPEGCRVGASVEGARSGWPATRGVAGLYVRMHQRGELIQAGRRVSDVRALLSEALARWGTQFGNFVWIAIHDPGDSPRMGRPRLVYLVRVHGTRRHPPQSGRATDPNLGYISPLVDDPDWRYWEVSGLPVV